MNQKHVFFCGCWPKRDITFKKYYSGSNEAVKITGAAECVPLSLSLSLYVQSRSEYHSRRIAATKGPIGVAAAKSSVSKHAGA